MNTSRFVKSRIYKGKSADRILIKCGCGHLKEVMIREFIKTYKSRCEKYYCNNAVSFEPYNANWRMLSMWDNRAYPQMDTIQRLEVVLRQVRWAEQNKEDK